MPAINIRIARGQVGVDSVAEEVAENNTEPVSGLNDTPSKPPGGGPNPAEKKTGSGTSARP